MASQWTGIEYARRRRQHALRHQHPLAWRPSRQALDLAIAGLVILLICLGVAVQLHA